MGTEGQNFRSRTHFFAAAAEAMRRIPVNMGSKHGTFFNRRRLDAEQALSEGNEILLGQRTLLFTKGDFGDRESTSWHYKKFVERSRPTRTE